MRYKMIFAYDGSYFKGFQRQKNLKTIQGELEKILSKVNDSKVEITGCGRTDTGVHAINSVAHFNLDKDIKIYNLKKHLNTNLDGEVYIKDIIKVNDDFYARYDAIEKEYRYFINIKEFNLFQKNYIYQYNKDLDIKKMEKALKILLGEHDFRSFCKGEKDKENCVRTITLTEIIEKDNIIEIRIVGNGFLRQMVRNIVGVLIEIGSGKKDITYMKETLDRKNREKIIKPASSCGLYLWDVKYK